MKVTSLIIPNIVRKLFISISECPAAARSKRHSSNHRRPPSVIRLLLYRSSRPRSTLSSNITAMAKYTPVTHVIFDMDGLILDTEKIYHKIMTTITKRYDKEFPWDVRMKIMGTTEQDCAKIMVEGCDLPITAERFREQQVEVQATMLGDAELLPGAEKLIRHLHNKKVPIAVATSSSLESVKVKIEKHKELFSLFRHVVSGSSDADVKKGKPNPDIFLVCCSRFTDNPSPEKCLVFEDAPNGVTAARAAGMQVVMVPDKTTDEEKRKGATLVIASLNDFKPEQFGLPPF